MKILKSVILFSSILLLSFALPRIIPGSPLFFDATDQHALNGLLPTEEFHVFKEYYAVDEPMIKQFFSYGRNILHFDLGYSFYYRLPVRKIIMGRIGWTLFLSITPLIISSFIGMILGLNAAWKMNMKRRTQLLRFFTILQAIPVFVLAVILQLILCYRLHIFPTSGAYDIGMDFNSPYFFMNVIKHAILPISVLILSMVPSIFILTYRIASKIKKESYVEMAYYYNVSEKDIKYKYILKNSLPEILNKLNIHFLYAISGALFVEAIFSYPGMGGLLKIAAASRDYPLLQGILLVTGIYGMMINAMFEKLIKKFNPRF
jgi:peptide/nickel transport system permease protein